MTGLATQVLYKSDSMHKWNPREVISRLVHKQIYINININFKVNIQFNVENIQFNHVILHKIV